MVASDSLSVTVHIEDLEAWTDVTKYDFDEGTEQGWTGGTVTDEVSVEVGGYSYRSAERAGAAAEKTISRSITLPTRANVRLSFFVVLRNRNADTTYGRIAYLEGLRVTVNGTEVFRIPSRIRSVSAPARTTTYSSPWLKVALDLSAYAGQTVTVSLIANLSSNYGVAYASAIYDRIVIAGKD